MKPFIAPEYQESLKIIGKKYVILRYRISPEFSTFDGHSPVAEIYRPGSICSIGRHTLMHSHAVLEKH